MRHNFDKFLKMVKLQIISYYFKIQIFTIFIFQVVVQYEQMDLIMHPVFQRLLHVKWNLFGRSGSIQLLVLNLFYTLIWTILGLLMPRELPGKRSIPGRNYYVPVGENWGRLILEPIGVCLTG